MFYEAILHNLVLTYHVENVIFLFLYNSKLSSYFVDERHKLVGTIVLKYYETHGIELMFEIKKKRQHNQHGFYVSFYYSFNIHVLAQ